MILQFSDSILAASKRSFVTSTCNRMRVVIRFQKRGEHYYRHHVINYCDLKIPKCRDWCHRVDPFKDNKKVEKWLQPSWETVSKKSEQFLHGPASCRKSKKIYYPCDQNGCFLGCPCFKCQGVVDDHSVQDLFDNHQQYHHARHHGCDFCSEISTAFPCYSYDSFIVERKYETPLSYDQYEAKRYIPWQSYRFQHRSSLTKISEEEQLYCENCDLTFTNTSNKYRHVREKDLQKSFSCNDCATSFSRDEALKRHIETVHEDGPSKFVCQECDLNLGTAQLLSEHMKKFHLECQNCNQKFSRQAYKAVHMSKPKSGCHICGEIFCTKRQLILHKAASHSKEKNFHCDECGTKFTKKWLLDRHRQNSSKFHCNDCNIINLTY